MNVTNTKEFTIKDIESLTFDEAAEIALEHINIKDHDILFVDFGGYFGYSALVFKNKKHIYYANVLSVVSAQNIMNERVRAELITRLHNDNKGSIRVFEWYTGVKLPRSYKDRIKVLEKITPDDYVKAI